MSVIKNEMMNERNGELKNERNGEMVFVGFIPQALQALQKYLTRLGLTLEKHSQLASKAFQLDLNWSGQNAEKHSQLAQMVFQIGSNQLGLTFEKHSQLAQKVFQMSLAWHGLYGLDLTAAKVHKQILRHFLRTNLVDYRLK